MVPATPALVHGKTIQRPIEDFLSTQGTFCVDDGVGGCLLFVPPDPNFLGWTNDLDSAVIHFAGVDYAGLADAYAPGKTPSFSGTVTERPLPDGHAEVTVRLHTKNANVWVIELDLSGDVRAQISRGSRRCLATVQRTCSLGRGKRWEIHFCMWSSSIVHRVPLSRT